jgi:hypothetical protein
MGMICGLSHKIVTQQQYAFLFAAAITSAMVSALMSKLFFFPCQLLPVREQPSELLLAEDELNKEGWEPAWPHIS